MPLTPVTVNDCESSCTLPFEPFSPITFRTGSAFTGTAFINANPSATAVRAARAPFFSAVSFPAR